MNAIEQTRQRSKAKDYFVCTVCGYATSRRTFQSNFRISQVRESQLATGPSNGRPASSA